jgi:hypothetical protein
MRKMTAAWQISLNTLSNDACQPNGKEKSFWRRMPRQYFGQVSQQNLSCYYFVEFDQSSMMQTNQNCRAGTVVPLRQTPRDPTRNLDQKSFCLYLFISCINFLDSYSTFGKSPATVLSLGSTFWPSK